MKGVGLLKSEDPTLFLASTRTVYAVIGSRFSMIFDSPSLTTQLSSGPLPVLYLNSYSAVKPSIEGEIVKFQSFQEASCTRLSPGDSCCGVSDVGD